MSTFIFSIFAGMTILSATIVAFSRNIIHSAFSLLFTFAGVAGLYIFLSADFIAALQVLIYIGGILVLIIFAVMLTTKISTPSRTNEVRNPLSAIFLSILIFLLLSYSIHNTKWKVAYPPPILEGTASKLGDSLLSTYLLPFEIVSILLLAALIGAVFLVRKEIKKEEE